MDVPVTAERRRKKATARYTHHNNQGRPSSVFTFTFRLGNEVSKLPVMTRLIHTNAIQRQQIKPPRIETDAERMATERRLAAKVPMSWTSTVVSLLAGLVFLYFLNRWGDRKKKDMRLSKSYGRADIGGAFELTTHTGERVTDKDFLGKWLLVYFGFTNCPDVCPEELEKIAATLNVVGNVFGAELYSKLVPLFVTVDPARDSAEEIGKYVHEFHPRFIGLTGNKEEINKVTKTYRIYYSAGEKDNRGDYILDHSIVTYLMGPDGKFRCYFTKTDTPDSIADTIHKYFKEYNMLTMKPN